MHLADLNRAQGKFAEAEPFLKRALEYSEKALGVGHRDVRKKLNRLTTLYRKLGQYDKAETLLKRSLCP